jgi:hypothetical protein
VGDCYAFPLSSLLARVPNKIEYILPGNTSMQIESGYFFITDITGYTGFLAHSELDHAKEILDALFDSILENIEPPLIISNTQGDAIICYAPQDAFLQAQNLLDEMEQVYFNFRRRLNLMDINTVCDCNACVNMSSLDLKIFIHYGQYLVQQIGDRTDLQGSDVILAHRLMKNSVAEELGLPGYGLITQAALAAMGVDPGNEGMIPHIENYKHYGQVDVFIHNLRQAWEKERQKERIIILPENAVASAAAFVPVPPWIVWDYMQDKEIRLQFNDLRSIERTDGGSGRPGIGSAYHCVHKFGFDIKYLYVDYDPPHYVTSKTTVPSPTTLITNRIIPVEGGSRIETNFGAPEEPFSDEEVAQMHATAHSTVAKLAQIIISEFEAGQIDVGYRTTVSVRTREFGRPDVADGRFGQIA